MDRLLHRAPGLRYLRNGAVFVMLLFFACKRISEEAGSQVPKDLTGAQWISDGRPLPESDSLFYLDQPAPVFRKEFRASSEILKARLFITAAGYYQASLNGQEIGKNVLDPAWTDYSKRIYYTEYDVTSLLKEGDNCLGVSLGNGFYNPLPLRKWGRRNPREDLTVGKPVLIAKLLIRYKDGKSEEILTDEGWKFSSGPLLRNSVYLGVRYDAGKELKGWNQPGFDEKLWTSASIGQGPGGELQKAFFPPVRVTHEIHPIGVSSPGEDLFIVDMGENFTGTYKIRLKGSPGDTLFFRFGERIYPDGSLNPMTSVIGQIKRRGIGGPGAPDIAWQSDQYIFGKDSLTWFMPPFTYHTYRYMEIKGMEEAPDLSDIRGLFMHSDLSSPNSFASSSDLLNAIQEATLRTFRANLVSVQSDCAAREKFGYGGDLNATSESLLYNFQMRAFYRKTIYDWIDAMNDSSFVDTAPYAGIAYCGISWESAYLITQYYLYLYYKDTSLIEELYERNRRWMGKVARLHPEGIVNSGLSDHESLEPVPVQLTGSCHYLQCARIMSVFARIMGDTASSQEYERLASRLQSLIKSEFWDGAVGEEVNRQTLFSTLLYHQILPEEEIPAASDSLLASLERGPSGHFITGIFGTKYILETLSEYVSPEVVFEVVNSTLYPGWGYMIDRGATTIWETWKESDNTYSNCHPMFGSISEWYYRWLGGIRPLPAYPGFEEFVLAPFAPKALNAVQCTYVSPFGEIKSGWKRKNRGELQYELSIPDGSRARVHISLDSQQKITLIEDQKSGERITTGDLNSGRFVLTGGSYLILVE